MIAQNKRLVGIILGVGFLLMIPLIAMQYTNEVDWGFADFLIAGFLLLIAGLTCELVLRKVSKPNQRVVLVLAILLALLLVWAELAVGIFGTPFAGS